MSAFPSGSPNRGRDSVNHPGPTPRPTAPVGRRRVGDPQLAARLAREIEGDVLFDPAARGRYSTDASIYQVEPIGVVVPRNWQDVICTMQIAEQESVPILPRGAGTSQCGQTVGEALVIDVSKYLAKLIDVDTDRRVASVEPGLVLDRLNSLLGVHGLWFPVDVSTASRATLGGMAGNNSCGARSIRHGTMRDNVESIDAILANGERSRFGPVPAGDADATVRALLALGRREASEIRRRFPQLQRRIGGYNIDALVAEDAVPVNLSHLLVGSEGTLAFTERLQLRLQPVAPHKVLGICHFPSFYSAMDATQHLVKLGPSAVELVDRTMIDLSREITMFRSTVDRFVRGEPEALLLVEFAGDDRNAQLEQLRQLGQCVGDLGFPDAVVEVVDPVFQKAVWEVRKAGLNIMMSMKGDGKPVSFIEDCAVRLEDLAEYTDRLTNVFEKYGTRGTWYAHASVGCLHVRPVLNMKQEVGARKMRAIAEEAFAMVREYKGSHSGEHGDGLVRSEFHEPMFGPRMVANFAEVKQLLDPKGLMNPGKIVNPSKMDDRDLFRYKPDYRMLGLETGLDWSDWGGFDRAIEMCNNNGACRKFDANVMCPSFRVTRDERHLTRGRANTLRLALSGQLDAGAFTSPELYDTLQLCVSCKGCKRECPTGVDMAKLKIEFLHHYRRRHGLPLRDRLTAYLPRYARWASRFHGVLNLRNRSRGLAKLAEWSLGLSAERTLPQWHAHPFADPPEPLGSATVGEVALFADTFNRYFEPENVHAALNVLRAAGYRVHLPAAEDGVDRPLCCGRTLLSAGLVDEARREAQRTLDALAPLADRGIPIVGLEPSCLFTFRDEFVNLLPAAGVQRLAAQAKLFEEFLAEQHRGGRLNLGLRAIDGAKVLVHGHCHQKAFGVMPSVLEVLEMVPGLTAETVASSCCGMAGAFGYHTETYKASLEMAELELVPAIRRLDAGSRIVADGTSCRHQIRDTTGRDVWHTARLVSEALIR